MSWRFNIPKHHNHRSLDLIKRGYFKHEGEVLIEANNDYLKKLVKIKNINLYSLSCFPEFYIQNSNKLTKLISGLNRCEIILSFGFEIKHLFKFLKRIIKIKKFSLEIIGCLNPKQIQKVLKVMQQAKHLVQVKFEFSKFFQVPIGFLRSLSIFLESSRKINHLNLCLRSTPGESFALFSECVLKHLGQLKNLKNLSLCYAEAIQRVSYNDKPSLGALLSFPRKISHLRNLSLKIKSNSLSEEVVHKFIKSLLDITSLQGLSLDLMDTETFLDIESAAYVLDIVSKFRELKFLVLPISMKNSQKKDLAKVAFINTLRKYFQSHLSQELLDIPISSPTFSSSAQLLSLFPSLKNLKNLTLHISDSNDLMILSELNKLKALEEINIYVEDNIDATLTGFCETLSELHDLQVFRFVLSDKLHSTLLQQEDFLKLFASLKTISKLTSIFIRHFQIMKCLKIRDQELDAIVTCIESLPNLNSFILQMGFESNFSYPKVAQFMDRSEERRVGKECRSRWSPYH